MTKKAKADVWMPLYVAEWDLSTGHLTNEQDGAYGRLVRWYWRKGGPLPDDDEALASIVRVDVKTWRKTLRSKLAPFFAIEGGLWRHARVDATLAEWGERKAKASEKAAKAAAGRWNDGAPEAPRKPRSNARSDAPSTPSGTVRALPKQCPSPSSTEEEGAFSPNSSLSGAAVASTAVPEFIIGKFRRLKDDGWVNSYIRPCTWDEERQALQPATPFAGNKIRSEGRQGLIELEQAGHAVRVLEGAPPGGAAPAPAVDQSTK